jgi:hypothetical protein
MRESSGGAGEIIGGIRTLTLFALGLKFRSGWILRALEGGMVERRSGKVMHGTI